MLTVSCFRLLFFSVQKVLLNDPSVFRRLWQKKKEKQTNKQTGQNCSKKKKNDRNVKTVKNVKYVSGCSLEILVDPAVNLQSVIV